MGCVVSSAATGMTSHQVCSLTPACLGSCWLILAHAGSCWVPANRVSADVWPQSHTPSCFYILNHNPHHILCSRARVRRSLRSVDRRSLRSGVGRSHRRQSAAAARDHSATNWEPVLPAVRAGPPMGSRAGRRSIGRSFELWADFGWRLSGYLVISDRWAVGW